MKSTDYDVPTLISDIRKQWNGDFKPIFGRGTGAGEIKCPECFCAMGKLLDVPAIKPGANLDLVTLRGHINSKHPDNGCCNAGLKVDLSNLQMRDLLVNVMPMGWTYDEYVEQITGLGMVYNPDLGSRLSESLSDWIFDSSKYRNYLMRNARTLLRDIGSRYGTLKENKNGTYEMTTFGGVTETYEDAIHGCDSWYGYIIDVVKDDSTAYDPAQVTLLKHIHNYLENEKVRRKEVAKEEYECECINQIES